MVQQPRKLWFRSTCTETHDDVIKWKHFPRYWPFVRGILRSSVNSPHKGQWRGALMFPLICTWINGWVNNREAGDFRRNCAHCDVIVMTIKRYKTQAICTILGWRCRLYMHILKHILKGKIEINTLGPTQNGHHFAEQRYFRCIFLNKNCFDSNSIEMCSK